MGTRKTVVVIRHDDGYGDPSQFLHYLNIKLRGSDMVVESAYDGDMIEASKEAFSALVGAMARDDSVQGHARLRLRKALGIGKTQQPLDTESTGWRLNGRS